MRYMVSPRDLFEKAIAAFYRSSLGDAHTYAHARSHCDTPRASASPALYASRFSALNMPGGVCSAMAISL